MGAAAGTNPKKPRRLGLKLGLSFGILIASFLLLELVATLVVGDGFVRGRYFGNTWRVLGRFDSELGWANAPGAHGHISDGRVDYRARINASGFRDPERSLEKPPGVRRVVLIGDSVAWGWGVDDGERFSDLLEARLDDVEVINLGVPGYGTDQQYWNLVENGFAYEPDVVLLCAVINDVLESESAQFYKMQKPRFVRGADGTWTVENRPVPASGSAAGRWFRQKLRALEVHSAFVALVTGSVPEPIEQEPLDDVEHVRPTKPQLDHVRETASRFAEPGSTPYHCLGLVRDACAERGVPLIVTTVPHKHDQYLYEPRYPRPPEAVGADYRSVVTNFVFEAGESLGVPTVSVDGALLAAVSDGTRLHCGDGHLNEAGNRVVADVLEPVLRAALAD